MERYEIVRILECGYSVITKLIRDRVTQELYALKCISRDNIDTNVEREIVNHRILRHPNIIQFKEVVLASTYLCIRMEYATRGELFQWVFDSGRLSENQARYFFKQLISGVSYCHSSDVCHKDLKPENILLDESSTPRIKICYFGFSNSWLQSDPIITIETLKYMAPEILSYTPYNGKISDIWLCGVTLYVMLVGSYPFVVETIRRIKTGEYVIPDSVDLSAECRDLLSRMLAVEPSRRITIEGIQNHPWFLQDLPVSSEAGEDVGSASNSEPLQTEEIVMAIVEEARQYTPLVAGIPIEGVPIEGNMGLEEIASDDTEEEIVSDDTEEEEIASDDTEEEIVSDDTEEEEIASDDTEDEETDND